MNTAKTLARFSSIKLISSPLTIQQTDILAMQNKWLSVANSQHHKHRGGGGRGLQPPLVGQKSATFGQFS